MAEIYTDAQGRRVYQDPAKGVVSATTGQIIDSSVLQPAQIIPILTKPEDTTNYQSLIAGGQGLIGAAPPPPSPSDTDSDLTRRINILMGLTPSQPPSLETAYASVYGQSGIEAAQQETRMRQQHVKSAQAELAGVQAQIQGVIDKRNAQNLISERQASQGQVVGTILNRQQQEVNRQAAIEALPLQALALAAQAKIASLQGEAEFAQSTLQAAQDKLDTAFRLKLKDIENEYAYKKDLRNSIFDFLTAEEKTRAEKKQKEEDRKFTLQKDQIDNAQNIARSAMDNGQADIAAKITALDPKSAAFIRDLTALQAQIKLKPSVQGDFEQAFLRDTGRLPTVNELLNYKTREAAAGREPKDTEGLSSIDLVAYAQQWASTGKIPTGLPKGMFGVVSQFAKEMPKQEGTIIDVNTGVKPDISDARIDGMTALYDIFKKTEDLKRLEKERISGVVAGTIGKIFGSTAQQRYIDLRTEIIDLLARARTGAALTTQEEKFYTNQLPGRFTEAFFLGPNAKKRIDNFATKINGTLNTKLKANSASIVGFSTIKLGGKDYKVGDIIEVNGVKGRVLADGSIAIVQ